MHREQRQWSPREKNQITLTSTLEAWLGWEGTMPDLGEVAIHSQQLSSALSLLRSITKACLWFRNVIFMDPFTLLVWAPSHTSGSPLHLSHHQFSL